MKHYYGIFLLLAISEMTLGAEKPKPEVINQLSGSQLGQLKAIDPQSKQLLRRLSRSSDKGVSAARKALAALNTQDKQINADYRKLRVEFEKAKKTEKTRKLKAAQGKTAAPNLTAKASSTVVPQPTQLEVSFKQSELQLKETMRSKMQLVKLLASSGDISVANDLIESARTAHPNALLHQSVFVGLAKLGPLTEGVDYAMEVLNGNESGGFEIRAAFGYLTTYPIDIALAKAKEFAVPDVHPNIRDIAAWLLGKLEGAKAKDTIMATIEQSYLDRMGHQSKYYGLLGLAEIVDKDEFVELLLNKEYPDSLYQSAKRYAEFKHGDTITKERLMAETLTSGMLRDEQHEALRFILENNRADLLTEYALIYEVDNGLALRSPFDEVIKRLDYQVTGAVDNPIISEVER